MTVLVAQIGARRHYAVPAALHARDLLETLVTDLTAQAAPWRWLAGAVPVSLRPAAMHRLLGRDVARLPPAKVRQFPFYALSGLWDRRRAESQTDYWARRNAEFARLVVTEGFDAADTVYAFNGAALEIFEEAKREGLRCVLDQSAAPWRWNAKLLHEEAERWPGWETEAAEIDLSGRLSDREEREWMLANRIVCGSEFAAHALADTGGPSERCAVVPYPNEVLSQLKTASRRRPCRVQRNFRVLFVGTLQLRKGVQYLLEAGRLLKGEKVTIRLVGPSCLSEFAMRQLQSECEVVGAVPRPALASHYAWADVLVLPTLSEGAANVCYEAMAAGLPVITTPNAGSIVRDGVDGLIVSIRDAEALAAAISRLAAEPNCGRAIAKRELGTETYASELLSAVIGEGG